MGSSVRKGRAVLPAEQATRPSREQPHRAATEDYHHEAQNANNGQAITAFCKNKDTDLQFKIQAYIDKNTVMIFSNTACSLSAKVKELFKSMSVPYCSLELDQTEDGQKLQDVLYELTMETSVPIVFVQQKQIGDYDKTLKAHKEGKIQKLLETKGHDHMQDSYDYDLIVIGGGSGGLAASKEAAKYGKKVMVLDYVTPTPQGTRWVKHSWETMTEAVQNYIGSLNWGYRVSLREKKVTYENAFGEFVGPHTIKATNNKGKEKFYTAEKFLIATGERPRYLGVPGDKEYCITSDDLFSLPYCPGKTLVVGASYVALECAGFLAGLGLDVTVMVRSILLRGFDQEMANKIGEHMEEHGVKFVKEFVPIKVEQIEEGTPGKLKVIAQSTDGREIIEGEYNTVLVAVGRDACTRTIGLDRVGVKINERSGKIPVSDEEQTNVPYIYAIGDVLEGKLELTPVAIQAGRLLAQRLYAGATLKCDYVNVPTTVFTPLEYGACGFSEETALEKFGEENIEVYHSYFWPLEWTLPSRDNNKCYAKIICNIQDNERVIGFHVLGPNAGEVTQGFSAAIKCGLTKAQLDNTIGIHPVCAEIFTTLSVTKRSGGNILQSGC
ncbi:thioredoxin reductase 1, cytoplasmic isoform X2 [Gopherus flavomarginatus]|uniref:thioredoxin reductase 1, cytoplasmic isoform X2 n=1 Tax=Gopherus flavomarginatus TaxID=286002 RepID=UPI0021CBD7E7|nr:thioredoxin reductase 1, cytoplasmic isoform X2 [Gopherus flavomarginatus]